MNGNIRVLFDHQIFDRQQYGGASRLYVEVAKRLGGDFECLLGVEATRNEYLLASSFGIPRAEAPRKVPAESGPKRIIRRILGHPPELRTVNDLPARNRRFGISQIRNWHPDILVPTYFHDYFPPDVAKTPLVSVVLDLIPEKFPEFFLRNDWHTVQKRRMVTRASQIIAISNSVRFDLENLWNVDPAKITVAPLASSFAENEGLGSNAPVKDPYLLYVGDRWRYKNFYFMVEALLPFFEREPDWKLVCLGSSFSRDEKRFFSEREISDKVVLLQGDDAVGAVAYRHCSVVMVPSQAEGFGLPVIEAFSFGKPVVASRIPVFEEIGRDLIEFFEPKDHADLRAALARAINSSINSGDETARRGRASEYSWERTASAFATAFNKVLE